MLMVERIEGEGSRPGEGNQQHCVGGTLYISEPRILYLFCILSRLNLEIDNGVRSGVGGAFRMHGVY